ncbi:DUF4365 domain-containing protein [Rhizobium sp. Rhizsp42]|uniref:DUF4365 domain-containing protein n=1 Tax=Rhizobium sp. Rhizsp42 TaxID=3243034 RepID=UPI0039B08385
MSSDRERAGSARTERTNRSGVHAVGSIFLGDDFEWFFRPQEVSDVGIDAIVEILDNDEPTGRLIALQIKTGASYFRSFGDSYAVTIKNRHLEYWTKYDLPVYLILADPKKQVFLWVKVERRLCEPTRKGWKIKVPKKNALDASAKAFFERFTSNDPRSMMRSNFALDRELIEEIEKTGDPAIFVWEEWVNKGLTWRNLRIHIDGDRSLKPDLEVDYRLSASGLPEIMAKLFPWCTYSYAEDVTDQMGEVNLHVLSVELRAEAIAYLQVERFFEAGYPAEQELDIPYEPDDQLSEDEYNDMMFNRRVAEDG